MSDLNPAGQVISGLEQPALPAKAASTIQPGDPQHSAHRAGQFDPFEAQLVAYLDELPLWVMAHYPLDRRCLAIADAAWSIKRDLFIMIQQEKPSLAGK
jgi:hypothetical protein